MPTIPNVWGHYSPFDNEPRLTIPEDAEASDARFLQNEIDKVFDKLYPPFEPEVITSITGKEYYLPALKVLKRVDGVFHSPQKEGRWENMELEATCKQYGDFGANVTMRRLPNGSMELVSVGYSLEPSRDRNHAAPDESCDCGIYGSVNLEEVKEYIQRVRQQCRTLPSDWSAEYLNLPSYMARELREERESRSQCFLCLIEPSPDAKVILCRKGWKAGKAFISEIVDETMGVDEASSLLSLAWHRNIDIRSLYENR